MGKDHRGHPSDVKGSEGTGVPAGTFTEDLKRDEELTDRYTDGGDGLTEGVRTNHPNRNVDKDDATTAGGYRN